MNAQILGSHLLREFHGVVALPACRFHLHGRGTQGLIWDPLLNDLVVSALPAVVSLPARSEIQLDAAELETQAGQASAQAPTVERSAVFGGSLLRHFGHFCHESLARIDGSAMYLLWFAKLRPGARVSIILRRRQGVWMSNKVRALMPVSVPIHWRVIDEVIGEELTSGKDWESHNLLDLHAIARRILAVRQLKPSPQAEQALVGNLEALAAELRPEDLARILQVLIGRMVSPEPRRTAGLRTRLLQGFRSLVGRASRPGFSR